MPPAEPPAPPSWVLPQPALLPRGCSIRARRAERLRAHSSPLCLQRAAFPWSTLQHCPRLGAGSQETLAGSEKGGEVSAGAFCSVVSFAFTVLAFPRPFSATHAGDVCHRKHLHPYMSVCQGLVLRPTSPPLPSHLAEAVGGQVGWVHCTVRGSRGGHSSALSQPRKPPAAPSSSGAGCSTQPSPAPPAAPAGPTGDQHHCRSPLPLHNKPCDRASCCCFWALLTRPGTQRVLPAPASPPELPQCHQHLHMAPAPPGGPVCPWPCTWQRCPAGLCHAGLCHGVGTGLSAPSLSPRQHRAVKMWGLGSALGSLPAPCSECGALPVPPEPSPLWGCIQPCSSSPRLREGCPWLTGHIAPIDGAETGSAPAGAVPGSLQQPPPSQRPQAQVAPGAVAAAPTPRERGSTATSPGSPGHAGLGAKPQSRELLGSRASQRPWAGAQLPFPAAGTRLGLCLGPAAPSSCRGSSTSPVPPADIPEAAPRQRGCPQGLCCGDRSSSRPGALRDSSGGPRTAQPQPREPAAPAQRELGMEAGSA